MKKKYSRFRELWSVPKFKILFKLGGWILFFALFFLIYALGDGYEVNTDTPRSTIAYNKMRTNLTNNNLKIIYNIFSDKNYFIEGTLINNEITGTLELEEIIRIKITEEGAYLIKRDEEEKTDILNSINLAFLFPQHIINIINRENAEYSTSENNQIHFYTVDNLSITVYINETEIYKIIILEGVNTYELEFSSI